MSSTPALQPSAIRERIVAIFAFRETILILVILVGGIAMTIASPVFLTWSNLEAMLLGLSVEGTIAVGMVILLVSGGLDLSVGSTLAFTGVVCGLALVAGVPAPIAIIAIVVLASIFSGHPALIALVPVLVFLAIRRLAGGRGHRAPR
jgi:ribose/xylose/arabinose/galactoside ABC-type transport system permease subunit